VAAPVAGVVAEAGQVAEAEVAEAGVAVAVEAVVVVVAAEAAALLRRRSTDAPPVSGRRCRRDPGR
jgi:hypothetical protein